MAVYSTYADARTAYLANSDYADGSGDLDKAQAFRSACVALQILTPAAAESGGQSNKVATTFDSAALAGALARVNAWIDGVSGGRVLCANLTGVRS